MKEKELSHAVIDRLHAFRIRPKHHLGQNFLVDDAVYQDILDAAHVSKKSCVIEVGTGLATLTELLADHVAHVVTVENDYALLRYLPHLLAKRKNVTLVPGSILDVPNEELFRLFPAGTTEYQVVANIPYYITGKIIQKFITGERLPKEIILMVQKEVADRISAPPGGMSMLSVVAQSLASVEFVLPVERESFYPEPKVRSAIIRLVPHAKINARNELEIMFKVAKMGFAHRRKKLAKGLSGSLHMSQQELGIILEDIGVSKDARPQELALEQWENLTKRLVETGRVAN